MSGHQKSLGGSGVTCVCVCRDIKYMDWKRFRNLRVPENIRVALIMISELDVRDEFAVDSDECDLDVDPSGRVSGVQFKVFRPVEREVVR